MPDQQTLAVYDRMADAYGALERADPSDHYLAFEAAMVPGARVLDLGCGPGSSSARLAAAGFDVLAVDGSSEMVSRAGSRPGVTARQGLFDDVCSFGEFGGIWASFSLLHASRADFPRHLADLHAASAKDAPFGLGMKLGRGEAIDELGRFYTFYTEAELRRHLSDAGFMPGASWHGRQQGLAGTSEPWIFLLSHA